MPGITTTILDCLKVDGTPIITWINNLIHNLQAQIDALETDITNLHTDVTNLKNQLAALQALVQALQACCANMQQYIANNHIPLTITHLQDAANRATLNVGAQILNIPPAIAARATSTTTTALLHESIRQLPLALDFETVPNMVQNNGIVAPRTGRYNLVGSFSANADEPTAADGYALAGGFLLNGNNYAGRYTAGFVAGRAEQTNMVLPGQLCQQGDAVGLFAYTDLPGGVTVDSQYLALEYIEGT